MDRDPNTEGDPAQFLLSNSKYHDCHLTVGNPETDDVETIGVSTIDLIAHSSVFRDMLADSKLADPSGANTHIKDVSPATFKLMLRHVYGGKLPKLTPEEAVDLALCADKYNIQRLVWKATKRLKPSSAADVFPALMCAAYIKCPDLEHRVNKIIQQETDKIVQDQKFLELDENCILFIVKQSILNISELELWKSLVLWADYQVEADPEEKTVKGCLSKVLPYVRLLLFTHEEITKHVLPTEVLTTDEFMDLTLAVTKKQTIHLPRLCNFREKRVIFKEDIKETYFSNDDLHFNKEYVFNPGKIGFRTTLQETINSTTTLQEAENRVYSTLSIVPTKNIMIDTFVFKCYDVQKSNENYPTSIEVTCNVLIFTFVKGLQERSDSVTLKGGAAPKQTVTFPVRKVDDQPLILEIGKTYTVRVSMTPALPTHKLMSGTLDATRDCTYSDGHGMSVKYEDPFHIREITYKVQE